MSFTQQYCNQPAGVAATLPCANNCFDATGGAGGGGGACYVVPRVAGFSYGTRASVLVTGSCSNPASDLIRATATMAGVSTTVSIAAACTP